MAANGMTNMFATLCSMARDTKMVMMSAMIEALLARSEQALAMKRAVVTNQLQMMPRTNAWCVVSGVLCVMVWCVAVVVHYRPSELARAVSRHPVRYKVYPPNSILTHHAEWEGGLGRGNARDGRGGGPAEDGGVLNKACQRRSAQQVAGVRDEPVGGELLGGGLGVKVTVQTIVMYVVCMSFPFSQPS
jgi:hypothetical protein